MFSSQSICVVFFFPLLQSVQHDYTSVLACLVKTFPSKKEFRDLVQLTDYNDPESDFFEHMKHIQVRERRSGGLRCTGQRFLKARITTDIAWIHLAVARTTFVIALNATAGYNNAWTYLICQSKIAEPLFWLNSVRIYPYKQIQFESYSTSLGPVYPAPSMMWNVSTWLHPPCILQLIHVPPARMFIQS